MQRRRFLCASAVNLGGGGASPRSGIPYAAIANPPGTFVLTADLLDYLRECPAPQEGRT